MSAFVGGRKEQYFVGFVERGLWLLVNDPERVLAILKLSKE